LEVDFTSERRTKKSRASRNRGISKQRTLSSLSAALRHRMCHDSVLTEMVKRADSAGDALHYLGSNAFDVVAKYGQSFGRGYCDQLAVVNAQIDLSSVLIIRPRECPSSSLLDRQADCRNVVQRAIANFPIPICSLW
jgi:hypothetical protein